MIAGLSRHSKRILIQTAAKPKVTEKGPGIARQALNLVAAVGRIARSGFARVGADERERRRAKCLDCEYWDAKARKGLGKCRVCGCTRLKHPWVSETCPKGKWVTSFYHSGEVGDLLYGLPTMLELGGGSMLIGPKTNVVPSPRGIGKELFKFIRPLLEAQPYIRGVYFSENIPGGIDYDLNQFREILATADGHDLLKSSGFDFPYSLAAVHACRFGVKLDQSKPWLSVPNEKRIAGTVFARSPRYQNQFFPWAMVVDQLGQDAVFVGLPQEHQAFESRFGKISFYAVADALELACVIAGADRFVGNQSAPMAIALGLGFGNKKKLIQEVNPQNWPNGFDCKFNRPNAVYCWDGRLTL